MTVTQLDSDRLNRRARRALRKAQTAAAETPNGSLASLVASAVNVRTNPQFAAGMRVAVEDWQEELWLHYDACPEFSEAVEITANNVSRALLIGVELDQVTGIPKTEATTDPDVVEIMGQILGGPQQQGQGLAACSKNIDVAGIAWLHVTDSPGEDGVGWQVLSCSEVQASGLGKWTIIEADGLPREVDFTRELLIRVWSPHPKRRWLPRSPGLPLLPVLRELAALTAMVSATVKSRLASAGILWIPSEIKLPSATSSAPVVEQEPITAADAQARDWLDVISEGMTAPIEDPDSASAVVPIVTTVKAELIEKIRYMEFGKQLDAEVEPLRQSCVKRLAVGLNLPASVLLGLEDANHWTAWAITEDYATAYIAPKLQLICSALTSYYLRPALRMRGKDPNAFAVYFDLSKLVPRQISAENATLAWNARLIKDTVYAEALGFGESEMATAEEKLQRLFVEMLQHANPEVLAEIAPSLVQAFPGLVIVPMTPSAATAGKPVSDAAPLTPQQQSAPSAQTPPAITPPPASVPPQAGGS